MASRLLDNREAIATAGLDRVGYVLGGSPKCYQIFVDCGLCPCTESVPDRRPVVFFRVVHQTRPDTSITRLCQVAIEPDPIKDGELIKVAERMLSGVGFPDEPQSEAMPNLHGKLGDDAPQRMREVCFDDWNFTLVDGDLRSRLNIDSRSSFLSEARTLVSMPPRVVEIARRWTPAYHHESSPEVKRIIFAMMMIRSHVPESMLHFMPIELMFELFNHLSVLCLGNAPR